MPFVTFAEQYGFEKGEIKGKIEGKIEGLLAGLQTVLRVRFAADANSLVEAIEKIDDPEKLTSLLTASGTASLDDIRNLIASTNGTIAPAPAGQ